MTDYWLVFRLSFRKGWKKGVWPRSNNWCLWEPENGLVFLQIRLLRSRDHCLDRARFRSPSGLTGPWFTHGQVQLSRFHRRLTVWHSLRWWSECEVRTTGGWFLKESFLSLIWSCWSGFANYCPLRWVDGRGLGCADSGLCSSTGDTQLSFRASWITLLPCLRAVLGAQCPLTLEPRSCLSASCSLMHVRKMGQSSLYSPFCLKHGQDVFSWMLYQ